MAGFGIDWEHCDGEIFAAGVEILTERSKETKRQRLREEARKRIRS